VKLINKPLTEKQRAFANIYVAEYGKKSATECAREAGYDVKSAYQRAHELLNPKICPHVVKYIDEIKSHIEEKYKVTFDSHVKELWELREKAKEKNNIQTAVRAEELRAKVTGFYVERSMNINKNIEEDKFKDQTPEEIEAELDRIIKNAEEINKVQQEEYDPNKHNKADD